MDGDAVVDPHHRAARQDLVNRLGEIAKGIEEPIGHPCRTVKGILFAICGALEISDEANLNYLLEHAAVVARRGIAAIAEFTQERH